jgi:hypothetical protein
MESPEFLFLGSLALIPFLNFIPSADFVLGAVVLLSLISFMLKVVYGKRVIFVEQYDIFLLGMLLFILISGIFVKGIESFSGSLGMIVFAVVGVCVNLCAALFTREGGSLNQRAVNLHMLEDVLGWAVVLLGAIVMRFTDFTILDPLLSMAVAGFILIHAIGNLSASLEPFLEKAPRGMDAEELRRHLVEIEGVLDVHHIHLWSMDGQHNCDTMHLVVEDYSSDLKRLARDVLRAQGIALATLELELASEQCNEIQCCAAAATPHSTGHHHAHGGHHHAHSGHHHAD